MKNLIVLGLIILMCSCNKQDSEQGPRLYYDLDETILTIIEINVIPMEGLIIDLQEMYEEVNADYYNRYNIRIKFNLKENQSVPDKIRDNSGLMFIPPRSKGNEIDLYILPDQYLRFNNRAVNGYAIQGMDVIILRESSYKSSTTSHEIGHILSLGHFGSWNNNVMGQYSNKDQFDEPSEFNKQQLDSIQINLEFRKGFKDYTSKSFNEQIIID